MAGVGLLVTLALTLLTPLPSADAVTTCPSTLSDQTLCEGGFEDGQCPSGYLFKENIPRLGCSLCGACVRYKGLDEECSAPEDTPDSERYSVNMVSGRALVDTPECAAGLECGSQGHCQLGPAPTECQKALHTYRTEGLDVKTYLYEPRCEADGTFAAVQCQTRPGSFMYCFCVNEIGNRTNGRDLATEKDKMNCACSRRVEQLKAEGRKDITLHCMANGNYEPLQCDQDVCFCVNSTTAQPYGATVARDMWKGLPCYSSTYFPGDYNRLCESMNVVASEMVKLLSAHGMTTSDMYQTCDSDGGYGAKVCTAEDQMCRCRDKAGNAIAPYVVDSSHDEVNTMNCRCARDHNDKDPVAQMFSRVKCETTGNYAPEQCVGDTCYCVDEWGERSSLNVDTSIEGVGDLIRCCLPCLKPNTLQCDSNRDKWISHCPEGPPDSAAPNV
ncbi:uncharacterized protein LOC122391920 [Amphibalanus amphitrite]|uniref:uncharacterized protein LOC122391920 n=1 Tax=Amphibalanus amphitrite TaxID=1232801 RepID=UPI001C91DB32|nr:uncharacterized protein LOC122391920 [Amphibalanus amphitrite]